MAPSSRGLEKNYGTLNFIHPRTSLANTRAPTLEFRLKMVEFRPISDQILGEIQTKSDHFLDKFGLYAWNSANFRLLPVFRAPTMSRTLKKLVAVGGGCLVILSVHIER